MITARSLAPGESRMATSLNAPFMSNAVSTPRALIQTIPYRRLSTNIALPANSTTNSGEMAMPTMCSRCHRPLMTASRLSPGFSALSSAKRSLMSTSS